MANDNALSSGQSLGLVTFAPQSPIPSAYLNNLNTCIQTLNLAKHVRNSDEEHTGAFTFTGEQGLNQVKVTTTPTTGFEVLRLVDIANLGGEATQQVACYTATQLLDETKVIWTLKSGSGVTVNGLHVGDNSKITGFQVAQTGFFTIIISSFFSEPGSVTTPVVTLNKLVSVSGTTPTVLETHHGLDVLIWEGQLTMGEVLYVSCTDVSGVEATHKILIRRGVYSTPSATTAYTWPSGSSVAPTVSNPVSQSILVGATATFSVTATGTPAPVLQWKKGGYPILGATSNSYTTPVSVIGDNGSLFTVTASSFAGSVTSDAATLTVTASYTYYKVSCSTDGLTVAVIVGDGFIYTSRDMGVTWTKGDLQRNWSGIALSSNGATMVAVAYNDYVYTSLDYGVTWDQMSAPQTPWKGVSCSSDGLVILAVGEYGIWSSTNGGSSFWNMSYISCYSCKCSSNGSIYIVSTLEGLKKSINENPFTALRNETIYTSMLAISSDASHIIENFWNGALITTTGGVSWTQHSFGTSDYRAATITSTHSNSVDLTGVLTNLGNLLNGAQRRYIHSGLKDIAETAGGIIFIVAENRYLHVSTDLGNTYTVRAIPLL